MHLHKDFNSIFYKNLTNIKYAFVTINVYKIARITFNFLI